MIDMPNWTPGPWLVGREKSPIGSAVVALSETPANSDDERDYYGGFLVAESLTLDNARLVAHTPSMADALAQWQAAEAMGDEREMENARNERDRILRELMEAQS